jgi:hypothetical protein
MKKLTTILSLFLFLITKGQMYYISQTGNDVTGSGSQTAPWKTLSKATSTVTTGTINISPGTYPESGTLNLKAGVSIEGSNKTTTIISASASERIFSNTGLNISLNAGDYIEIKGVQPTWATNPLTTIYGGYLYFE